MILMDFFLYISCSYAAVKPTYNNDGNVFRSHHYDFKQENEKRRFCISYIETDIKEAKIYG